MKFRCLKSVADLVQFATNWDDLWSRSSVTIPTARAETTAQTISTFHPDEPFFAIAVEEDGRWLALLSFVIENRAIRFPVGRMTTGAWPSDCLLVDMSRSQESLPVLIDGLRRIPVSLLWLENVPISEPHWQAFRSALTAQAIPISEKVWYSAGRVMTEGVGWDEYLSQIPRDRRAEIRRTERRLSEQGALDFRVIDAASELELAKLIEQGFMVEDLSWKGQGGSSVIQRGWLSYVMSQATVLWKERHLKLCLLMYNGQPIAFAYCPFAKNRYHIVKYAYDPAYRKYGPGQILMHHLMRVVISDGNTLDMPGELTFALTDWARSQYTVGQIGIAPGFVGRCAVLAHKHVFPTLSRFATMVRTWSRPIVQGPSPESS